MNTNTKTNESQEKNWKESIAKMERDIASLRPPMHLLLQVEKESTMKRFWNNVWVDGFLCGLLIGGLIFLATTL